MSRADVRARAPGAAPMGSTGTLEAAQAKSNEGRARPEFKGNAAEAPADLGRKSSGAEKAALDRLGWRRAPAT